jgi:hypothetical protein
MRPITPVGIPIRMFAASMFQDVKIKQVVDEQAYRKKMDKFMDFIESAEKIDEEVK